MHARSALPCVDAYFLYVTPTVASLSPYVRLTSPFNRLKMLLHHRSYVYHLLYTCFVLPHKIVVFFKLLLGKQLSGFLYTGNLKHEWRCTKERRLAFLTFYITSDFGTVSWMEFCVSMLMLLCPPWWSCCSRSLLLPDTSSDFFCGNGVFRQVRGQWQ